MARLALSSTYHRGTLALILLLGTAASVLSWRIFVRQDAERIHAGFISRAQTQTSVTKERLRYYEEMVYSLRDAFLAQNTVTRKEFAQVAQSLLERHAGVQALEWIQIVPRESRGALEALASHELGRPFLIQRLQPDGTMRVAPEAAEYFVITYVEPLAGNEAVLGYDVSSAPTFPSLAAARTRKSLTVSPPFHLRQSDSPNAEPGLLFILPVGRHGMPENPTVGFVQGVFHAQTMLAQSHRIDTNEALDSYYLDLDPRGGTATLLYANLGGREPLRTPGTTVALPALNDPADVHDVIEIGGRQWRLVIRQNAAWARRNASHEPAFILAGGLAFTILLALFINSLLQRTDRIQHEVQEQTRQLRASEARLQGILDHSPNSIFVKDVDGRYVLVNKQQALLWNRTVEDYIGHKDDDLFPPEIAAQFRASDRQMLAAGTVIAYEATLQLPWNDGLSTVIVQKFPLRDADGRIYGICGISTDITAHKRAEADKLAFERNLLETQKLESLGVLAGGIAHDFNNLLTAVLGNATLARAALGSNHPGHVQLEQIELAARRAADLCQQMLAYAGKGKLSAGPIDLARLVRDTTSLLEISIRKNCALVLELADGLPAVTGDATQLRQIVMNLVINSSDAIGERSEGRIVVSTFQRHAEPGDFRDALHRPQMPAGNYVGLEVRDNGCGMTAATVARIFEPFFTTKFSGRGLGLSAVLGIVQSHHGALFVESQPGAGSTFRLLLPAGAAPPPESRVPAAGANPSLHGTVLVVDDEDSVRQVAGKILERNGATVLLASNGRQGLELFQQHRDRIGLILLDLTMPGLSGADFLRELPGPGTRPPVIVMSGYSDAETTQRCEELGAVGFLHKPFELQTILTAVRTHLA